MLSKIVVVESVELKSHMLMESVGQIGFGNASSTYTDEAELIDLIEDADAIVITSRGRFTKRVISAAGNLRIIAKCGALPNNVDIKTATELGIPVTWTPGSNAASVAEHAVTMIMNVLKLVPKTMAGLKKGKWHTEEDKANELMGKTVGIVGFGQAGSYLTKFLKPYEVEMLVYDPYVSKEKIDLAGARKVDLEVLLTNSDVVTLHCHMCEETHHMINKDSLKFMKENAFLVNTARGGLIDETALYEALTNKWIAGAGLDVFEVEPASKDNPLFTLDNILITPHMAGWTKEALIREAKGASDEVVRVLKGELPLNVVNPDYVNFNKKIY